ncbi:hypothetical protein C4D60_Mb10t19730 [Musa balbisiana]|uniref:Uncharacterized protein n=1 Tax=Musa balbisiana TaxID=52838 RepID=A0A4S8IYF9_MUSBA|nr:hypothetical protein C4D60_Mb10t19730 [Musa balbisiana]
MVEFSKWVPEQGKLFDASMITKSRRYVSGAISLSKVDERRDNKMQLQRHVWMWELNKVYKGEKNLTQFQADATNSSLVAGSNPADSGDDKGTFHGVSICRGLSSIHLEENSTMASLEGERFNTTIMKCSSDSTQKVVSVQDYGAKGVVASDFMVFTRLSSPTQISMKESLLIIYSIHSVGTQEQTLSPQAYDLLKPPANLKSWGHSKRQGTKRIGVAGTPDIGYSSVILKASLFEVVEPSMTMGRYGRDAPARKASSFNYCKNLRVENLKVMDNPRMHISLEKCTSIDASHSTITTPNESPNIDGIHVAHSKRIKIANSFIGSDKFYTEEEEE